LVTVVTRFRCPLSPPLHFSTPGRSAHDLLSHTFHPHCWASGPHPHLQTWPPVKAAPRESVHQPLSLPSRPLEISTIWSRFSTRPPPTWGSPPRVSPPSLLQTFPPSLSGDKWSSRYSAPPFNRASTSRRPWRTSRLKSTTCSLRLLIWTSPRNPQTSPHSKRLFATLPPVFRQPLRPLSLPNALVSHNRPHTPLVGLVPTPPSSPTPLAKKKARKELLQLHPHHHLIRSSSHPQLTRISQDTTCPLHLPQCMATLRRLPKNTPTPGKQSNSPKGNTPPVRLRPPVIWTPTGVPPPP